MIGVFAAYLLLKIVEYFRDLSLEEDASFFASLKNSVLDYMGNCDSDNKALSGIKRYKIFGIFIHARAARFLAI